MKIHEIEGQQYKDTTQYKRYSTFKRREQYQITQMLETMLNIACPGPKLQKPKQKSTCICMAKCLEWGESVKIMSKNVT